MDARERVLYNQVHPVKLATDVSAAVVSLYLFWTHDLVSGLIVHVVPSVVVSAVLIRYVNLDWIRDAAVGRYLRRHMTAAVQGIRLAGDVITVVGAWYQNLAVIVLGVAAIAAAWFHGLVVRHGA